LVGHTSTIQWSKTSPQVFNPDNRFLGLTQGMASQHRHAWKMPWFEELGKI
jgi:hypothetical protein